MRQIKNTRDLMKFSSKSLTERLTEKKTAPSNQNFQK